MPFFRCSSPVSGGGDSGCQHISYEYDGETYEPCLYTNLYTIPVAFNNQFGNAYMFNSPVTIGDKMIQAYGILKQCNNFNSTLDISNANNLISVVQMLFRATNFNCPIVFPKSTLYNYSLALGACWNYNQPTEIFIGSKYADTVANCDSFLGSCNNFDSQVKFEILSNIRCVTYNGIFLNSTSFNQPVIFKKLYRFYNAFNGAINMECPILINHFDQNFDYSIGQNILTGTKINTVIFLNYKNQKCDWYGNVNNMVYYADNPDEFIARCNYLYAPAGKTLGFTAVTNGYKSTNAGTEIYVLNNVSDACNDFNNFYFNLYNEYPVY